MSHGHAICSLTIYVVEVMKDATKFFMNGSSIRGIAKVEVACEKLVRPLAREDNLHML